MCVAEESTEVASGWSWRLGRKAMGSPLEAVTSEAERRRGEYFLTGGSRMMAWGRGDRRRRGSAGSGGSPGQHRSREEDGGCERRNRRLGRARRRTWQAQIGPWTAPRPEQPETPRKTDGPDERANRRGPADCPPGEGPSAARSRERRKRGRRWRPAERMGFVEKLGRLQATDPDLVWAR